MWNLGREGRVRIHVSADTNRLVGLEEVHLLGGDLRSDLSQDCIVVQHPDPAAIRADDQIIIMNHHVAVGRHREILHQRLPVVAVVEGDKDARLRAGEQQPWLFRIGSHESRKAARGLIGRKTIDDLHPRLPVVSRAVDVRRVVAAGVIVDRDICRRRIRMGRLDRRYVSASWIGESGDAHVFPRLSIITGDLHQAIVGTHPDRPRGGRRRGDRFDRAA